MAFLVIALAVLNVLIELHLGPWPSLLSSIALACVAWAGWARLRSLQQDVALTARGAAIDVRRALAGGATGDSHRFLEAVRYRLQQLEWQREARSALRPVRSARRLVEQADWLDVAGGKVYPEALYQELVTFLHNGLGCSVAAAAAFGARGVSQLCSAGLRGRKWNHFFQRIIGTVEPRKIDSRSLVRLLDLAEEGGPDREFGMRYAILALVPVFDAECPTAILLGYPESRMPSEFELSWMEEFCSALCREVRREREFVDLESDRRDAARASEEKSRHLALFSHDVRAPLHNIRSVLQLFRLEGFGEDAQELVESALKNCGSLEGLVDSILEYSRHAAGALQSRPEMLEIGAFVEELASDFAPRAREKGLDLAVSLPEEELIFVRVDPRHLRRVVANLVENAIKYTEVGAVRIGVLFDEETAGLEIRDTGCGFTEEQRRVLFSPFTRFRRDVPGVGLGLALTKKLVEENGGQIRLESSSGHGSSFRVSFERVPATPAADCRGPARSGVAGSYPCRDPLATSLDTKHRRRPIRVLVVDDERDYVRTMVRALSAQGFTAMGACDVDTAIATAFREQPHVVLIDINIPTGGGGRLVTTLDQVVPRPHILVLSGETDERLRTEMVTLGAEEAWLKPVDLLRLASWIDQHIDLDRAKLVA